MISKFFETPEGLPGQEQRAELPKFDPIASDSHFEPEYIRTVFGDQAQQDYIKALGGLSLPPNHLDKVQVQSEVDGFATFPPKPVLVKKGTEGTVVIADEDGYVVEVVNDRGGTECLFNAPASILKVTERWRYNPARDL